MLLGFKRRFAPFVKNGSKTHTIRAERARPPHIGEICHCYVDPRQASMRLIGRWPCTKIETIEVRADNSQKFGVSVKIDGIELSLDEKEALAWRDGFRSSGWDMHFLEMITYWKARLPFRGYVIHWKFS